MIHLLIALSLLVGLAVYRMSYSRWFITLSAVTRLRVMRKRRLNFRCIGLTSREDNLTLTQIKGICCLSRLPNLTTVNFTETLIPRGIGPRKVQGSTPLIL